MHIIVAQLHGHWSAWFAGTPQVGFGGEYPSQAIERLLEATQVNLDPTKIVAIEEATKDGHLEFIIPMRRGIPRPSLN